MIQSQLMGLVTISGGLRISLRLEFDSAPAIDRKASGWLD
jgi:hypothetical protein